MRPKVSVGTTRVFLLDRIENRWHERYKRLLVYINLTPDSLTYDTLLSTHRLFSPKDFVMKRAELPPIPAYYRLQKNILSDIENGRWKPGNSIPPERTLSEVHHVSIGTVKKALLNLIHAGYIYRIQGKGTFVAGTPINRESVRYYRLLKNFGDEAAILKLRLLKLQRIAYFEPAGAYLGINPDEKMYEMQRLFVTGNRPVVHSISYLPINMFKDLDQLPKTLFETVPLYKLFEGKYGLPTLYNHELFDAVPADWKAAHWLKTSEGAPILQIEMLSFTYRDKAYEYRKSFCRTRQQKVFREI